MKLATAFVLAASALGCSVPQDLTNGGERQNTCTTDADCTEGGGVCSKVGTTKICTATQVSLAGLRIAVQPPGGLTTIADAPTVFSAAARLDLERDAKQGFVEKLDLALPEPQKVTVTTNTTCTTNDGNVANVEVPSSFVLSSDVDAFGLPSATIFSQLVDGTSNAVFSITPGTYQTWITPEKGDCKVAPPPAVFDFCFLPDRASCPPDSTFIGVSSGIPLPESYLLTGSITSKFSLEKWTLDVIDKDGARTVSDLITFGRPSAGSTLFNISGLRFNWADRSREPLIRITPPPGSAAPTIYWDLATAVGPSGKYDVKLNLGDYQNQNVVTEVFVFHGKRNVKGASVSFTATSLTGLECLYTLSPTVLTNEDGFASVSLPPGRYQVVTTPPAGSDLAVSQETFEVSYTGGKSGGHGIPLPLRVAIDGDLMTAGDQPASGVLLSAQPSLGTPVFVFGANKTATTVPGASSTTTTDDSGHFSLLVDANSTLDISAQPSPATGLPWLVVPHLLSQDSDTGSLEDPHLTWPAVIHGVMTDVHGVPVANASVTAYLPVVQTSSGDGEDDPVAVQIGAATTDENGNYVLLLPASIGVK